MSKNANELKDSGRAAAGELMDQAKNAARELPQAMADVKASVGLVADQVKETAREQYGAVKDYANDVAGKGRAALSTLESRVAERPLGYALAAAAIGLLVGLGFRAAARRT